MNSSSPDQKDDNSGANPPKAGLSGRRDQLNRTLNERKQEEAAVSRRSTGSATGYAQAVKMSSEFIAGIIVGAGMGWLLDEWLGTSPFGLIVFLLLGFVAGVLNVLRAAGQIAEPGAKPPKQDDRSD
ncbi:MAG: AtpZ/AtpI family protein [Roseibium sp.]